MPTTSPNYSPPLGSAVPTPPGQLTSPQAPSGASLTAVAFTSSWNFVHGMLSVQADLNTDEGPQQGLPAISNVASITIAGVPHAALQVFRWQ